MLKARAKRPRASIAELSFIRSLVDDIQQLRWLRKMLLRQTLRMRRRVVERVVNALYRRYRKYTKGMVDVPGFLEWLDGHRFMHDTYNYHSYATRYYWASRPVVLASRYELSTDLWVGIGRTGDDSWYFALMQELINLKDPRDDVYLRVRKEFYKDEPTPEPKFKLKDK